MDDPRISLRGVAVPAGMPDGQMVTTSAGRFIIVAPSEVGVAKTAAIKYSGGLAGGAGQTRLYNDSTTDWTITSVRASVETAPPTGGSVVVDVNVSGTTIFSTQTNRPTIAAGLLTSGKVTNMDVTTVPVGSWLTVDIDTAASPAANLTVQIGLT